MSQDYSNTATEVIFDKNTLNIILKDFVGVATVTKLFAEIHAGIDQGLTSISIDPSEATGFDTTSVQLLIALIHYSNKTGIAYKWLGSSERLTEVSEILNLHSNLNFID